MFHFETASAPYRSRLVPKLRETIRAVGFARLIRHVEIARWRVWQTMNLELAFDEKVIDGLFPFHII